MESGSVARLIARLVEHRPGSKAAEALRRTVEHRLMAAIRSGGRMAATEQIDTVKVAGRSLELVREVGALRTWRAPLGRHRLLEVSVSAGGYLMSTYVDYRSVKPIRLTKQQEQAAALQAAFYSRYESIGARAYRRGAGPRLTSDQRTILLIGELEADVNNGGFRQYLQNKGTRRARAALRALVTVGATRTARWLESALKAGVTPSALERLDARFCDHPEDLACLVMRHLDRSARRAPSSRRPSGAMGPKEGS